MLTGGSAVRFQGADKASIEIGGATLLEHVLGALAEVPEVVVVGDEVITSRPVGFVREDPPGGGPAAGLLAGLTGFPRLPRLVVVLAVDMPLVTTGDRAPADALGRGGRRRSSSTTTGGASTSARSTAPSALLEAAPATEERHGLSMRGLVAGLRLAEVPALAWEARRRGHVGGPHRAARAPRRVSRARAKDLWDTCCAPPAAPQDCEP